MGKNVNRIPTSRTLRLKFADKPVRQFVRHRIETNSVFYRRQDEHDIAEAPQLRGGAYEREVGYRPGRHRGGPRQEARGQGVRQGVRGPWTVPDLEEEQGSLHRLDQRPGR